MLTGLMNKPIGSIFLLFCLAFSAPILAFFAFSYANYGHNNLPMGWDTPHYIGQMNHISKQGLISFMQENDYYNFGYATLSAILTMCGISPFIVEIFLPIALCLVTLIILGITARRFLEERCVVFYTLLGTSTWFAIYRLGTDLHQNLLALVILLAASYYFLLSFQQKGEKSLRNNRFFFFLALGSFVHIESAIFFSIIFIVCISLVQRIAPTRYFLKTAATDTCLVILTVLPSTTLFILHLGNLVSHTQGVLVAHAPLSIFQWLTYAGILFPIATLGFFLIIKELRVQYDPLSILIVSWALVSLALALAHYIFPFFQTFSERALILFPVPFLVGFGLQGLLKKGLSFSTSLDFPLLKKPRVFSLVMTMLVFIPSLLFTYNQVMPAMRVWITPAAYERLVWLSGNFGSAESPIFIFNDYDEYAGSLGDLYNNWVESVYGNHYAYLGDINFLLALSEMPFSSVNSKAFSSIFLEKMRNDDVFSLNGLSQHRVVLVTDFYLPRPLPKYLRTCFAEVYNGIYVFDWDLWNRTGTIYVSLYSNMRRTSTEGSYIIEREWADSNYVVEFWNTNPSKWSYVDFCVPIARSGNYSFRLRYWDGDARANRMIIKLNSTVLGEVVYAGSLSPANFTATTRLLNGTYNFQIMLPTENTMPQYFSIDYLAISFIE